MADTNDLKRTPLHDLHEKLGGRLVDFAGYALPVQFEGIMAEHRHTRSQAGLFDVSHMGQARITGDDPAAAFEALVPGDIAGLRAGRMRYTQFTNDGGGILDDLMVTRFDDHLFVVVNGAVKDQDFAHMRAALGDNAVEVLDNRALLALQGPHAEDALAAIAPEVADLTFLQAAEVTIDGAPCLVSRSGYTGEDGFEISIPAERAAALAETLLARDDVWPVGLGARDSLRLEAGLCLYGHDIDETTTPVEAALTWSVGKRRREEGGFPGADIINRQIHKGVERRRVGIRLDGKAPAREGADIQDSGGRTIGQITSGGFGPSVEEPIAMGYVDIAHAAADTPVQAVVRGRDLTGHISLMPFVPTRYVK